MSYKKHYLKRLEYDGDSARDAFVNRSRRYFDNNISRSPSYYKALIDGEYVDTIINNTTRYEEKLINFKSDYKINLGSIVEYKGSNYLIIKRDRDEIYQFARMKYCNNTFKIETFKEKVLIGEDKFGRPQYKEVLNHKSVPCVVEDKYYSSNDNAQLPLPEGRLVILVQYQEAPNIRVNYHFNMYGKEYKISDIRYTQVIDGVGYMEISAERITDGDMNE